ncbi:unnamed protein product [Blepharisma stoltei]|uniref:Uncharacterized protein n=1 Tax=Blepharisma stoltei TaxID=1481888 RepID=A0AAU9JS19_9CILI|nr:unnamed protein product [Blepharisma stoltei]
MKNMILEPHERSSRQQQAKIFPLSLSPSLSNTFFSTISKAASHLWRFLFPKAEINSIDRTSSFPPKLKLIEPISQFIIREDINKLPDNFDTENNQNFIKHGSVPFQYEPSPKSLGCKRKIPESQLEEGIKKVKVNNEDFESQTNFLKPELPNISKDKKRAPTPYKQTNSSKTDSKLNMKTVDKKLKESEIFAKRYEEYFKDIDFRTINEIGIKENKKIEPQNDKFAKEEEKFKYKNKDWNLNEEASKEQNEIISSNCAETQRLDSEHKRSVEDRNIDTNPKYKFAKCVPKLAMSSDSVISINQDKRNENFWISPSNLHKEKTIISEISPFEAKDANKRSIALERQSSNLIANNKDRKLIENPFCASEKKQEFPNGEEGVFKTNFYFNFRKDNEEGSFTPRKK